MTSSNSPTEVGVEPGPKVCLTVSVRDAIPSLQAEPL